MKKSIFLLLSLLLFPNLHSIELTRVILSTNNNPTYIEFWPIVAPLWSEMGLQPTLALIGDENCNVDTSLGDVIHFPPLKGVPESMQAQAIRLLLPTLFPNDGCLISDIDMIPIDRAYFFEGAKQCNENEFLVYRDKVHDTKDRKISMCYVAAKGHVFDSIFGVNTHTQIEALLRQWAAFKCGWNTDELMLFRYVANWEKVGKVVRLGHGVLPRLDRLWWDDQMRSLDVSKYVDCHCPRPYSVNKKSIDKVVKAIRKLWRKQDQKR